MSLAHLSDDERRIVGECLVAAVRGPFFPEWEFSTLFGLERSSVAAIAVDWPRVDEADPNVQRAINNAMANLLGYPHGCERDWHRFISADPGVVNRIFAKWREE